MYPTTRIHTSNTEITTTVVDNEIYADTKLYIHFAGENLDLDFEEIIDDFCTFFIAGKFTFFFLKIIY
jgi:hypothetical protein